MHSNGMRLLKLINDLLDLVRLESGRMEVKREPLEVAEFVKGLASAARQVAEDKRIKLETFVDPALGTVLADRDKLEKIVLNLLFNALKFTPAGGRVELRAEKQGEEFVLIVSDTGMGISEKNLPFVFDRFWQADGSSKRKYQGVGIGLALVKELVEIQGGKVTVESQEGKGTTFTVRLPYQKAEAGARPEARSGARRRRRGGSRRDRDLGGMAGQSVPARGTVPGPDVRCRQAVRPVETAGNGRRPTMLVADDEPDMLRFLKSQLSRALPGARGGGRPAGDGEGQPVSAGHHPAGHDDAGEGWPAGLPGNPRAHAHAEHSDHPAHGARGRGNQAGRAGSGRERFPGEAVFDHRTARAHQEPGRIAPLPAQAVPKQNQVLESTIEQLKETETQLVQTEKLASLGRMSAGIIHEINNPLNFATTGLFTLRNKGKQLAPEQQRGIRGNSQGRGRRHQAGAQHRLRLAHVHASRHRTAATRWRWPRWSARRCGS